MIKNLVVIDPSVSSYQSHIDPKRLDTAWLVVNSDYEGISQILDGISAFDSLESLQIISHGSVGALYIGSTTLTVNNLGDYSAQLSEIGSHLSEGGVVALYGCNIASGVSGQAFIQKLAEAVGVDVSASDDLTGNSANGGDSELEIQTGELAELFISFDDYVGTLAVVDGTDGDDTLSGTEEDDQLTGGPGSDILRGGSGHDTAIYSGNYREYTVSILETGTVRVSDSASADSLLSIERLQFADSSVELSPDGAVQAEFQVNTYTDGKQSSPAVTVLPDGGWLVTWESSGQDGSGDGVYVQRYSAGGVAVGSQFQGNTFTDGSQSSPAVATLSDGGWLLTWAGVGVGDASGIYAQRYAENGTAVGEEFWVNAYTDSPQGSPAVTILSDGDWLVVWQSFGQDGSGDGIYAQRFSTDGTAVGGEFQVNTYTESTQGSPVITALTDGGCLIAWQSSGQDGSGDGIYAQRYSADGVAVGGEFQVNTYTESIQGSPVVTPLPEGGWVAAWKSFGQDGSFFGVYAQRFAADGTTVGDEFQVNTYSDGVQEDPDITTLSDGGWLIVWESYGQDGAFDGIYGQRYAADGTTVGDEFQVNAYTASTQTAPDVMALPDGGWLVTWQSYGQDGSDFGIYSQRYAADGTAYSTDFDLNVTIDLTSFHPLDYIASHGDLINAFRFDVDAAVSHYLAFGFDEGRETTFDADWYIAKYKDLRNAFGEETDAATRHYIANGFSEGRSVDTSGDDYLIGSALNDLLPGYLGNDTLDGGEGIDTALFSGASTGYRLSYSSGTIRVQDIDALDGDEGVDTLVSIEVLDFSDRDMRLDHFDGLAYIVSHPDLIEAFGADREAGLAHYVSYGFHEGRQQDFDPDWYLSAHHDLRNAFGEDIDSSTLHYFNFGRGEGRNVDASGDDSLLGSQGDDILPGFAGNDTIDGKEGNDTARFFGDAAGYRLDYAGGVITVIDIDQTDGNDGTDTLRNVEILEFADRVLSLVGFDPLAYISTHADLLQALGSNAEAGLSHYIAFGFQEGRSTGSAEEVGLLGQADAVNDLLL